MPPFVAACAAVHTSIAKLHALLTSRSPRLTIGSLNMRKERNHRVLLPSRDPLPPDLPLTNRRAAAGANHRCQAPHRCFDCRKLPTKLLLVLSPVLFNFWLPLQIVRWYCCCGELLVRLMPLLLLIWFEAVAVATS